MVNLKLFVSAFQVFEIQSLASGACGMIEEIDFVLLCGAALEAWMCFF